MDTDDAFTTAWFKIAYAPEKSANSMISNAETWNTRGMCLMARPYLNLLDRRDKPKNKPALSRGIWPL